jgi:hypothetical protein
VKGNFGVCANGPHEQISRIIAVPWQAVSQQPGLRQETQQALPMASQSVVVFTQEQQEDEKARGGGTLKERVWNTRPLNTISSNTLGELARLYSDGSIHVPPGLYFFRATASIYRCNNHQCRLYSPAEKRVLLLGTSECASHDSNSWCQTSSVLSGVVEVTEHTGALHLQHWIRTRGCSKGNEMGVQQQGSTFFPKHTNDVRAILECWTLTTQPRAVLQQPRSGVWKNIARCTHSSLWDLQDVKEPCGLLGTFDYRLNAENFSTNMEVILLEAIRLDRSVTIRVFDHQEPSLLDWEITASALHVLDALRNGGAVKNAQFLSHTVSLSHKLHQYGTRVQNMASIQFHQQADIRLCRGSHRGHVLILFSGNQHYAHVQLGCTGLTLYDTSGSISNENDIGKRVSIAIRVN